MVKQNLAYAYNSTLSGNKKDGKTDVCYDMDETRKHYAKQKKPVTKDHTIHLYEMSRVDKPTETENRAVAASD